MPFFRYQVEDAQGKILDGTVQASSEVEAHDKLTTRGFRIRYLADANQAIIPQSPTQANPVQNPIYAPAPSPMTPLAPAAPPAPPTVTHTRKSTPHEIFFLFSQFASLLNAGVNPVQAFGTVGSRMRNPVWQRVLGQISMDAQAGKPVSGTMEQYPDLFPPYVLGLYQAGEAAGCLPEACQRISDQALNLRKMQRMLWLVTAVVINLVISIPLSFLISEALPRAYDKVSQTGGGVGVTEALGLILGAFWEKLLWPVGPATIATCLLAWLISRLYMARGRTLARHRLGLKMPIFGHRARAEGLSQFSWGLSRLSRAGYAPNSAWHRAAACVPNQALREDLDAMGRSLNEGTRLSEVFHHHQVFPNDFAPMTATAEMTGNVPLVMEQMSQLSDTEFQTQTERVRIKLSCWSCLGCFVSSAILLGMFWYGWYYKLTDRVLQDFQVDLIWPWFFGWRGKF